jgi:hypothetical protein
MTDDETLWYRGPREIDGWVLLARGNQDELSSIMTRRRDNGFRGEFKILDSQTHPKEVEGVKA